MEIPLNNVLEMSRAEPDPNEPAPLSASLTQKQIPRLTTTTIAAGSSRREPGSGFQVEPNADEFWSEPDCRREEEGAETGPRRAEEVKLLLIRSRTTTTTQVRCLRPKATICSVLVLDQRVAQADGRWPDQMINQNQEQVRKPKTGRLCVGGSDWSWSLMRSWGRCRLIGWLILIIKPSLPEEVLRIETFLKVSDRRTSLFFKRFAT